MNCNIVTELLQTFPLGSPLPSIQTLCKHVHLIGCHVYQNASNGKNILQKNNASVLTFKVKVCRNVT